MKTAALILAGLFLLSGSVLGQEKGTIKGRIRDAKTGEGLPSVNVKVKGSYHGAATNVNGEFLITNVSPGTYTIEISLVGYSMVRRTEVRVDADKETTLNQDLQETTLVLGQEVTVVGERPLVDLEETASRRTVTADDLKATAVVEVKDVVAQQVGVVLTDNEIHIRGGRSSENAYLLDGVSIQDPLAGTGFGLQLSAEAIEEIQVITGGYNAEYGQATSGVVNVSLREGAESYHGSLSYKRDHLGQGDGFFHVFNQDAVEMTLGGPEPITTFLFPLLGIHDIGTLTFFSNVYGGFTDGYMGKTANQLNSSIFYGTRFAPRQENNLFLLAKLTWRLSPVFRISYSYNHSVAISQNSQSLQTNLEYVEPSPGYQYEYQNILDNANTYTHDNQLHSINITHSVSPSLFYEVKFSHYFAHLRADANGLDFNQYREPEDIVVFPLSYYPSNWPSRDTVGVIPGDGLWDIGNAFTWHDHYVIENTLKFDVTKVFTEKNRFKAGFDLTFQEMQNIDIYEPWVGGLDSTRQIYDVGLNNDIYKVYPAFGSMYAQDNITYGGMILNVGLRFDYWAPGQYVDDAVDNLQVITIPQEIRDSYKNKTYSFFGHRWKGRLSPRVGISHPISDNQMLFFSYGHFCKRPKPQFVYAKLSPSSSQSSFQKFGNPDLDPETTVAYELGLQNQFSNNDVLTVTAYYKDIFDYVSTKAAKILTARLSSTNYITYVNQDYATSRGIEVEYRKRVDRWFRGSLSGSYSITTGKSSTPDQGVLVARGDDYETIKENYVSWDRPLQFNLAMTFNVMKGAPLFGFGEGILDDYSVYVRAFYQSGKRYTPSILPVDPVSGLPVTDPVTGRPMYETDRSNLLGAIGADWFWIDLNIEKNFSLLGLTATLSVEIKNLLDSKNSAIINPATGRAYEYGDPTPYSWNDPVYPQLQAPVKAYPYNPARYLAGRNLIVGLSLKF
jgi:outer membrane receptor protein involved in Fe transport